MVIDTDITISEVCNDDITIRENATLTFNGIANGCITVESSSKLIMNGVCTDDICIHSTATAEINGVVNNNVVNYGHIIISGIVEHLINVLGKCDIRPGSIVDGKRY